MLSCSENRGGFDPPGYSGAPVCKDGGLMSCGVGTLVERSEALCVV